MYEGMLSARIEHHSLERRKHGCRQCDLRRHHRTGGRCRLWRDEQVSRRGHHRDDAGSGMPRPGTAPAEPGTVAAHLGAVVFGPSARGGAGTFSGGIGNAEGLSARLSSFLLRSRQGTTAFAGILPFFNNAFRAQRVNLKVDCSSGSGLSGLGSKRRNKQTNKQCLRQQIILLQTFCNVIDRFASMRRPLSFRENLPSAPRVVDEAARKCGVSATTD